MEKISWNFSKVTPSRKNREAMQGEFFAANKDTASSLIREAIQNSLDAKPKHDTSSLTNEHENPPVKIRIYFSGEESALPWNDIKMFFDEAWEHYTADDNGMRNCPEQTEACKFVVIEDFNTTGLIGDVCEYIPPIDRKNPFYSFFRAEGQSNKSHTDRGRWGVGKFVFPKTSRIKTFFGLTIRDEDQKQFLVGQTILKSHRVKGNVFTPDGWFGWTKEVSLDGDGTDYLHMPIDEDHNQLIMDTFRKTFNIQRQKEPGLSIVVPFVDDDVKCDSLVKAVLNDYFWPILTGDLYVFVECNDSVYEIESGSLSEMCHKFEDEQAIEMRTQIELAKWATKLNEDEFFIINAPKATSWPKWNEELIDTEVQVQLRKKLEAEDKIAIRVPITIREKSEDGNGSETYFNVFFQRNPDAKSGAPVFIREGIIIPQIRCRKTPRIGSLVVADDPVIADFLGNAENPAHTDWHHNSENFKDKYYYGDSALRFVKNAVSHLIRIIDESSKQEDKTLLLDFFSIPAPSDGPKRQSKKQKDKDQGDTSEVPPEIPQEKPKRYKVSKVQGGFTISKGDKPVSMPATIDVKVFYDRRGGKAKYNINDFRLDKRPIRTKLKGIKSIQTKGNRLIARITKEDFHLTVKGFDLKRDILVRASIVEQEAEDAEI